MKGGWRHSGKEACGGRKWECGEAGCHPVLFCWKTWISIRWMFWKRLFRRTLSLSLSSHSLWWEMRQAGPERGNRIFLVDSPRLQRLLPDQTVPKHCQHHGQWWDCLTTFLGLSCSIPFSSAQLTWWFLERYSSIAKPWRVNYLIMKTNTRTASSSFLPRGV